MKNNRLKAQSTLQYVVLFGLIALALVAMMGLFNRKIQSNMRENADTFLH